MKHATSYVKALFQLTSLCSNKGIESLSSLINCFIYYTQLLLSAEALITCHRSAMSFLYWRVVGLVPASLPKCSNRPV